MDDAFDDPDYDPFDAEKRKRGPRNTEVEGTPEVPEIPESVDSDESASMDGGLADAFKELNGESPREKVGEEAGSGTIKASVDEALDNEDIEALFDD